MWSAKLLTMTAIKFMWANADFDRCYVLSGSVTDGQGAGKAGSLVGEGVPVLFGLRPGRLETLRAEVIYHASLFACRRPAPAGFMRRPESRGDA